MDTNMIHDDLTVIKGIGQVRREWLQGKLNIASLYDLATASADEIEAQFKAGNRPIARETIEGWIEQATLLAGRDLDESPDEDTNDWMTMAAFHVTYQQRYSENDTPEQRTLIQSATSGERKEWYGLHHDTIGRWIATRLPEAETPPPAEPSPEPASHYDDGSSRERRTVLTKMEDRKAARHHPVVSPVEPAVQSAGPRDPNTTPDRRDRTQALALEVVQVRIIDLSEARKPDISGSPQQLIARLVEGYKPFTLEVLFRFLQAEEVLGEITGCSARLFARALGSSTTLALGDAQATISADVTATHKLRLSQTALPPGIYRILISVTLENGASYVELPPLRVV